MVFDHVSIFFNCSSTCFTRCRILLIEFQPKIDMFTKSAETSGLRACRCLVLSPSPFSLQPKGRGTLSYPSLQAPARAAVGGPRIIILPKGPVQVTGDVIQPAKSLLK